MKLVIAAAVAAAFAVPAYAQQSTPPSAAERAQNREKAGNFARASALTSKVKSALAKEEGFGTLTRIDVDSTEAGVVTLKGKVESAEAKKKAETVAKQVDGVKSVKNQLTVEKKG